VFAAGYIAAMIGFVAAWFMRRAGHVEMGARTATTVAYVVTALGVLGFAFARSARR
jgi:hypothetical protein